MWKWCCLITSLSLFSAIAVNAAASSLNNQYPEVENSQIDEPLCYMQVGDGTTLDLQKLCNKSSSQKSSQDRRVTTSKFRQGTGKSYATDSQPPENRDK